MNPLHQFVDDILTLVQGYGFNREKDLEFFQVFFHVILF